MAKKEVSADYSKWDKAISAYETTFKAWETRVEKILKIYRDDKRTLRSTGAKFNILWSNVQTLVPACFSRLPKPSVSRRHNDTDPVGRVASLILERALEFEVEHYPDYRAAMKNSVYDRFLGGRGISWVRYEPHFGTPDDGLMLTEDADEADTGETDGQENEQLEIQTESAPVDYVHWKDFGHSIARTWEEVDAVWRKIYLGRDALVDRFGEELGNKIPLDTKPEEHKKAGADGDYQALIYEIWDKASGTAYWLSKSMGEIIDERQDPLGLEGFFPCPRPLFGTLTTDSLIPVPDYSLYQDQANALDILADRIDGLIKALQVKGVYDASQPELKRLFTEGSSGDMIPVKNWQAFAERQGLKGSIDLVELLPIAQALGEAYKAHAQIKQEIYEITGIGDVMRASSDPRETATAIKSKGQFGSMRLRQYQGDVAQYAQELLQIKAQVMCKHFQEQTLLSIGGVDQLNEADKQVVPMSLQLLKTEPLRSFRIEVSADSMIYLDEQQEKADRIEFLQSAGKFLQAAVQTAAGSPIIAPIVFDMLKFAVTGFKVGKNLEGEFDALADKLKQAANQPQQPKPDPEMAKIQATMQAKSQELQQKAQFDNQKMQADMQFEQWKQQMQQAQVQAQQDAEAKKNALQAQMDAQLEAHKAQLEAQSEQSRLSFEKWKAELDAQTKVAVAEIAAQTTLQAAQLSAAKAEATGGEINDKQPTINIQMPSTKRTIRKNQDGSYTAEDSVS